MYQEIYNLKADVIEIQLIQEASLSANRRIGLKTENGLLFGSKDWFHAIGNGIIQQYIIRGYVSKVFMSGHNDFPEFEVTDVDGIKSTWERKGNDEYYVEGRKIQIVYVPQKFKTGDVTNCIIAINIETVLN